MEKRSSSKGLLAAEPTSFESPTSESSLTEAHMVGMPKPGDEILGGKYEVERIIGVGGMGVVVAALHKRLGQRVAIKFLFRHMQTAELVDRFIREGQACARIKSEHIASVLDVGVLDTGTPYLMMEFLEGIDLDDYISEHGTVPIELAIDFVLQACDALAVAHSAGIVHRDLKPSNLFITRRSDGSPLIKVLDFGISKLGPSDTNPSQTLTRPGTMLGSPRYVSPEQLRNASNVDHRADIWAIGVVLHELIVGEPPYVADTFADLCAMITTQPPTPIRHFIPEAPEELEAAILKCIAKTPEARFQNVAEFAKALAPIAAEESRAIALRVGKILEVASSKATPSLAPPKSGPMTPRRFGTPVDSRSGRLDPTVARSGPRASSASAPTDPASALSVANKTIAKGWRGRIGSLAVVLLLLGAAVTTLVVYRTRMPTDRPAASANALPPVVSPPPEPTSLPAHVVTEPSTQATQQAAPTAETEASAAAPVVPKVAGKPVKGTGKAKAGTPPPSASPAVPSASSPQPQQQSESDMLNRRR